MPSWDDVRLFLALNRAGSLSAAAKPLGLTQPTCGRRLAALEASFGFRLFDRTPTGLHLTAEGTEMLEAAQQMERAAEALAIKASRRDRKLDGLVRIATNDLFACTELAGALAKLRVRYPGICIELVISNVETDLLKREADLAIRFRPEGVLPTPQQLVAKRLSGGPLLLYGAPSYLEKRGAPKDPTDLAGHDVVVFAGRHPAVAWCEKAFRNARPVLTAPSMQVAAAAIAAGVGLGVLPRRAERQFPLIRPLSAEVANGVAWLVLHPELRRVPRIRAVADGIVQVFESDGDPHP
ncbi:MAG: LysR family transcriptional regulator [Archangiaceae bacterium]|nr:LysR family transcriptional regulator [Archangiaceae bacterium]